MDPQMQKGTPISFHKAAVQACLRSLDSAPAAEDAESLLGDAFGRITEPVIPDSPDFYGVVNHRLFRHILSHYRDGAENLCLWRFIKNLMPDQMAEPESADPDLEMFDTLLRIYFHSTPLEDLTCLFIPISDAGLIRNYMKWIERYFYHADYPTSLLWLYALDSSLSSLFPDELLYLGRYKTDPYLNLIVPDFDHEDTVLIKRFTGAPGHFLQLEGKIANDEFDQIFKFLKQEYRDRCLSRSVKQSVKQNKGEGRSARDKEWEKFEDVLRFGVSDRTESGAISFSDMRASTEFLTTHGKGFYLNKIQQPFFENTKLISKYYNGRIDKFMGDNVMCVFLNPRESSASADKDQAALNNFFAIFELCRILFDLIHREGIQDTRLGLRSGVSFGDQILRSNLGNEFVRDFTVTGESVNLAARLEHISIHELKLHNEMYFQNAVDRFPKISRLISVSEDYGKLNPETRSIIDDFTLYQNIYSNLEKLERSRFDIRMNQLFYHRIQDYLEKSGARLLNPDESKIHGYEAYEVDGFQLRFYFLYYNPKGFAKYEKIWILPLEPEMLRGLKLSPLSRR
ncbi:MAG: adenylate/guanylate cyclase domain-containing protein [Thermodesulfobacteriota bacterium]